MAISSTSFKKGNQISVGNKGGRPRTVSYEPEEMIALGEEMIEYVLENDPLHINQFYDVEKMIHPKVWDTLIQAPEFYPYYRKAQAIISKHYLNGDINPNIAQRHQRVYFRDLLKSENEMRKEINDEEYDLKKRLLELEYSMKNQQDAKVSEEMKKNYESLMNQLDNLRKK